MEMRIGMKLKRLIESIKNLEKNIDKNCPKLEE